MYENIERLLYSKLERLKGLFKGFITIVFQVMMNRQAFAVVSFEYLGKLLFLAPSQNTAL